MSAKTRRSSIFIYDVQYNNQRISLVCLVIPSILRKGTFELNVHVNLLWICQIRWFKARQRHLLYDNGD